VDPSSAFSKQQAGENWSDWKWHLRNRIETLDDLSGLLELNTEEIEGIKKEHGRLRMGITPYFASLIDPKDPGCPLRRQVVPRIEEHEKSSSDMEDPCGEEADSPVPNLVHRYPDRVLLILTDMCISYCRYCTRKRIVGARRRMISEENLEAIYDYIASNRKIRDVLISGGDPLVLGDEVIDSVLSSLRSIRNVEILRIGTRSPVFLPQRITDSLLEVLRKYHPLMMSIHFSHPREITAEVRRACERLADAGIPLGSQTVLLRGINNSSRTIKKLVHQLLTIRVRPYYLYQCDLAVGTGQFRTSIAEGINIIERLRGHTSGYAVPTYVIDAPGGGGKIPLGPSYLIGLAQGKAFLRNYEGNLCEYPEPIDVDRLKLKINRGRGNRLPLLPVT
jgi:lysine 2,3-aminomutase